MFFKQLLAKESSLSYFFGWPDLGGREQEMAGLLFERQHAKLLTMSKDLEIFPDQQAVSAYGVGLFHEPSSTMGFENRWNPFLGMDRIVAANTVA